MRKNHLSSLIDPVSNTAFTLSIFEEAWDHIISGVLSNETSSYPIIGGVPRLLIGDMKIDLLQRHHTFFETFKEKMNDALKNEWQSAIDKIEDFDSFIKHQAKTAESFAFEWNNIYEENDFEKSNFLHFLGGYKTEKDFKDKVTLDVGCGSGRFTKWPALFGAKLAIGVDLSDAVDLAFKMTKDIENVLIVQWDIYHLPFEAVIDLTYSIGVLHHLPNPEGGFAAIVDRVVKQWWEMLIWVYARKNNFRALYLYEPVRTITNKMNKKLLLTLCHIPAAIVSWVNLVSLGVEKLWFAEFAKKIPFHYYNNFPYNMKWNDAFDVLATPKSNYYFKEDIEGWFNRAKLKNIKAEYLIEAGITCVWKKG
jgi:SAM-dependent methyltransferase/uncharacterized protein YbaR (Trm112 family)